MDDRIRTILVLWILSMFSTHFPIAAESPGFVAAGDTGDRPIIYKVICTGQIQGCACGSGAGASVSTGTGAAAKIRLHHGEAVYSTGAARSGTLFVTRPKGGPGFPCLYPVDSLRKMEYAPILRSRFQNLDHAPLPLSRLLGEKESENSILNTLQSEQKVPLGEFWPTYYHLALEEFYPGQLIPVRSPDGHVITEASRPFLEQVAWEGSGITKDGMKLHYTGSPGLFEKVDRASWGYGAGSGYGVYPYRTIAVNFPALCNRLKSRIPHCTKKDVIGLLVRIREVADGQIPMDGGKLHDGYFCASDTGSPYYIRSDRIDIFVGTHGGGNPYLPPARQGNRLIAGGIHNLVPSDWLLWRSEKERFWCDLKSIPQDAIHPAKGDCLLDYHVVAPEKALHLEAFWSRDGAPLRCKKGANL